LYINKTSGSGNAATIIGTINATTLVKSGGTSSQFLKADGTVDSSVYVPTSRELTINGVTYDLSANRSWTVSGGGMAIGGSITSATAGSILFAGTSGVLAQDNSNLFWDDSNNRLGIGTNVPICGIDARNRLRVSGTLGVVGAIGGNNYPLSVQENGDAAWIEILNNGGAGKGIFFGLSNVNTANTFELWNYQGGAIDFYNGTAASTGTRKLRIWNNGNVTIQNGGTFTDSGQRLQVQGTTLLNGNVTFSSATGMTWDATNSRLGIGTNAPTNDLEIQKNRNATTNISVINTTSGTTSVVEFKAITDGGRLFTFGKYSSGTTVYKTLNGGDGYIYNNTTGGDITIHNDFTSGNIKLTAGGSSTAQMTLHNTGNLLLGSTTNSGERLQVTGTAKITTSLDIAGGKVFSAYQSSNPNDALKIATSNNGAVFGVQNTNAIGFSGVEYINNSGTVQVFTGFNNNNNQEFRFNNVASGGFIDFLISSTSALRIFNNRSVSINSNTDIASAQFQITSTTKGFLPPRMTNAQRTAISSPAVGLIVYCTDMVEGLYVYKSVGWTFVI
jgi:hypothetical protein